MVVGWKKLRSVFIIFNNWLFTTEYVESFITLLEEHKQRNELTVSRLRNLKIHCKHGAYSFKSVDLSENKHIIFNQYRKIFELIPTLCIINLYVEKRRSDIL